MPEAASLFARKLRAYRARAGRHGRMTQEALAERLGLSTEAISKYERSQSFIRGDFEHRLIERLGWSAAEVAEARADWQGRGAAAGGSAYRVHLGTRMLDAGYAGYADVGRAITRLIEAELPEIAEGFAADDALWVPIISTFPMHGAIVHRGAALVAHWGLQFLDHGLRDRFRAGRFTEPDMALDRLQRPILPGRYFCYCPVVAIARGHEACAPLMLSSFLAFLRELAARDVFLEGIGAVAVTAEGRRFCRDLGFRRLCAHATAPGCEMWEMPGAALPGSVLLRGDPALAAAYRAEFAEDAG